MAEGGSGAGGQSPLWDPNATSRCFQGEPLSCSTSVIVRSGYHLVDQACSVVRGGDHVVQMSPKPHRTAGPRSTSSSGSRQVGHLD